MLRIGHRGASGLAPENTLASFRKALEIGVDGVELDVRETKDHEIVLMHDGKVDRTTNGSGFVQDMTLSEIKRLDAGSKFGPNFRGEKVPTLKEALELLNEKLVMIEIKEEGTEEKVLGIVRSMNMEKNVWIVSFHRSALVYTRQMNNNLKIALISEKPEDLQVALNLKADAFSLLHTMADRSIVKKAHRYRMLLCVWTPNNEEEMRKSIKIGADILTTDFPDRLNRIIHHG